MQTSYSTQPDQAFAGLLGDVGPHDALSRAFQAGASPRDVSPFGVAMVAGTDPVTQAKLPTATAQVFLGIAVHKHRDPVDRDDASTTGIEDGDTMSLLTKGRVWVRVEEAVAPGDAVYFRHTQVGAEQAGAFRNDADGGDADQITSARWASVATGAGIALLEINVP
jgi:hypothetical protein